MPLNISGDIAGLGKIVQVVRAIDTTQRTTTSTSYVDTGMSVSITPNKSNSSILILASFEFQTFWTTDGDNRGQAVITDSSNVVIPGAQEINLGSVNLTGTGQRTILLPTQMLAWDTPATTSSVTYKIRFRVVNSATTLQFRNSINTGQMFAIEVAA